MKCPNCGAEMQKTKTRKPLGNPNTWICPDYECRTGKARIGFKKRKPKRGKK